jgi:outer membrane protein TolC
MKQFALILYFFISVPLFLLAQTTYKLSVSELFDRGFQNSLAIQSSLEKVQISKDKKSLAEKNLLPGVELNGTVGYAGTSTIWDKDFSFLGHPKSPVWRQNYQFLVSQPLYEGGQIKKNIRRADLENKLAELSLENDKSSLKLWLIGRYIDLFNLYKKSEVYQHHIQEAQSRLHNIEKMKEEGMVTNNDVLRSQLLVSNYELLYEEGKNDIILASQQLDIILGMNEDIILQPEMNLFEMNMILDSENVYVSRSYSQYSVLGMARTNIELAQNNLNLTKANYLPKLSLQASNTLARPIPYIIPAEDDYINSWGISLNLSFYLSTYFSKKSNLSQARRQINLSKLAFEQEKQTIRTQVKAAYIKHKEALDRVNILQKSLEQSNENYRIVKNKYFNSLSILTDLLDATAVQLESELQLTEAKTNAIYTYYQLLEISGNL